MVVKYDQFGRPLIFDDEDFNRPSRRNPKPPIEVDPLPETPPKTDTPKEDKDETFIPPELQNSVLKDLGFTGATVSLPKPISGSNANGIIQNFIDLVKEYLRL